MIQNSGFKEEVKKMANYSPPTLNQSYTSNASIYQNAALENSVFKLSHIFLDYLFPNNLLPGDLLEKLIDNPDDITDILGKSQCLKIYQKMNNIFQEVMMHMTFGKKLLRILSVFSQH